MSLSVGEKKKLTSKIEPYNCIDTVSWKSTDTNVATVKNDGTITGVSAGTCVVQATTGSGKAALCEVTVTASKSSGTKSNSASKTKKLKKGKKITIKVTKSGYKSLTKKYKVR